MAEVTPTALRAGSVSMVQVLIVLGVLIGFAVSKPFFTAGKWAGAFACATPLSGLLLVLLPLTPESPRWLMSKGHGDKARAILRRLRGLPPAEGTGPVEREAAVATELAMIAASLADAAPSSSSSAVVAGDAEAPATPASPAPARPTRYAAFRALLGRLLQPHILLAMGTGFTLGQFQQMSGMVRGVARASGCHGRPTRRACYGRGCGRLAGGPPRAQPRAD